MIRVLIYDRRDNPLMELSESDVFELTRHERVNGEHSLTVTTSAVLEQGWRVLTRDARGTWREHVVYGTDEGHAAGERPFGTYYCTWSLQHDLMGTRVSSMPGVQTPVAASIALDHALAGTSRWQRGTVTNANTGGASMYDTDGWSAMSVLVANWGGEVDATIEVGSDGVVARKADLYSEQGEQVAKRRYDFGADIQSVRRKLADGPLYCRITPRGKGEETDSGFYGRRVTIAPVNHGRDYLENPAMVELAKLPDGNGGWEYPTLEVENSDCETPSQLLAWAQPLLEEYTQPKVTYELDVMQAAREGVDMHGVSLGDAVQVVDGKFGVRISARVLEMTQNLLDEWDAQIVLGNVEEGLSGLLGGIESRLAQVSQTVAAINGGGFTTADYLSRLLDRLNGEINATGGYTYITEGEGLRTYDTAVTDPLVGSEASAVVEVKGGTIRIANSKTAQGAWEWKTVFTSGHIAADVVTAAHITTGYIGSSGDTFIDLDNHTVQLGKTNGNHVIVNSSGVDIYNSSTNLAFFGQESNTAVARVGQSTHGNVIMKGDGSVDVRYGSEVLAHFGYGEGKNSSGGTSTAPFYSLGERNYGSVVGNYSIAEGINTTASGYASHAEGHNTTASSVDSHAEGYDTTASGNQSHAEGYHCTASAFGSHAEGYYTEASGYYAHAEGESTKARGSDSHASGYHTIANTFECVIGSYNVTRTDTGALNYVLIAGGGTGSNNRRDALRLDYNGNLWIAGALTQNSDKRLKEHIAYLGDDAAEFVGKLRPALFEKGGKRHLGFYAQDVQDADDWATSTVEAQHTDESLDFDPLTLDYSALIAPLVAYAQSLEKRIGQLEKRLEGESSGR